MLFMQIIFILLITRINIQYNLFVVKSDKLGWSTERDIKNRGPMSQQVWHDKDPSRNKGLTRLLTALLHKKSILINCLIVFYAVSAMFRPYNGGSKHLVKPVNDNGDIFLYEGIISERDTF